MPIKNFYKTIIACLGIACLLSSCVTTSYMITDNPVGSKTGVAKYKMFSKDHDISLEKAAANGGITKIGTVETRITYIIIFPAIKTTVTGD